jgi:hypothetical protein
MIVHGYELSLIPPPKSPKSYIKTLSTSPNAKNIQCYFGTHLGMLSAPIACMQP